MADGGPSRGKKCKRADKRPARMKYWFSRKLEQRKAKALMGHRHPKPDDPKEKVFLDTMDKAISYWHKVRQGRVPSGYLRRAV